MEASNAGTGLEGAKAGGLEAHIHDLSLSDLHGEDDSETAVDCGELNLQSGSLKK